MDKKLTDNEIVKALKRRMYKENKYMFSLLQNTLDLINRLQADYDRLQKSYLRNQEIFAEQSLENERLKAENERLQEAIDEQDIEISRLYKRIDEAKTEAYKEFAERLKENSIATFSFKGVVMVEEIDDLVKEMTGEDNESKN